MSLPMQQIAADVSVAPQLTPEAMAEAARLGFKAVVNNRPDFEHGPDQPTRPSIQAAASIRRGRRGSSDGISVSASRSSIYSTRSNPAARTFSAASRIAMRSDCPARISSAAAVIAV